MYKALGGAASGAATGTMIMPGWGTAIGAGVGLLGGLFAEKADAEDRERAAKARAIMAQEQAEQQMDSMQRNTFAQLMQQYGGLTRDRR